ncbi:MAG: HEAT repeat domain-containing protein [Planctomycetes bacterium]|nr:HEAT repeat domain-containing protein [Planctomycetota bacterium]
MSIERLLVEVRQNRPEAQATAAQLGAAASPSLVSLTADAAPEVRAMALICLGITGGDAAAEAALTCLSDDDDGVVAQALQVLRRHPPHGHQNDLILLYRNPPAPYIREDLPLIAGELAPEVDDRPWVEFWKEQTDPVLTERLMVGLARMGHDPARERFVRDLLKRSGPDVIDWLDYARYMADPWVLPHLAPLLEKTDMAIELQPDSPNTWPLRTCDLVARAIIEIAGAKVDFEVYRATQYTREELARVRRIALQTGK